MVNTNCIVCLLLLTSVPRIFGGKVWCGGGSTASSTPLFFARLERVTGVTTFVDAKKKITHVLVII